MITFETQTTKKMSEKETISELKEIKIAVSKLAISYATIDKPIPIPEFTDKLKPFVKIERAILKAISKLEKDG